MTVEPVVELNPIHDHDIDRVADFLHRELNPRVTVQAWAKGISARWVPDAPNHGFMLVEDNQIVGANIAFYSQREINGRSERFCNLGALCVVEQRRSHAIRLVRAIMRQPGYHFTDLSPSGNVIELNRRLGFHFLDTATAVQINWPAPPKPSVRIITDLYEIEQAVDARDQKILRDHWDSPAVHHLLLRSGRDQCYVIGRRDRRKGLPLFATILYVSDQGVFHRMGRHIARHLLLRMGAVCTLFETRVTGRPPTVSVTLRKPRPKMFKSSSVDPSDIDYLYSELTQVEW